MDHRMTWPKAWLTTNHPLINRLIIGVVQTFPAVTDQLKLCKLEKAENRAYEAELRKELLRAADPAQHVRYLGPSNRRAMHSR